MKSVQFLLILPKFCCQGNSPGSIEILDNMSADPKNLTLHEKVVSISCTQMKLYLLDFLCRTEIGAIFAYFCPNFVAMASPLAPLKI